MKRRQRRLLTRARSKTQLALFAVALLISLGSGLGSIPSAQIRSGPDPGFLPVNQQTVDAADVWIDSEANGFDTYVMDRGPSGTPRETGDPLVLGVVHRIYARVHNFGDDYPNALTLQFYVQQPIGFGDESKWRLIGTLDSFGPVAPRSFRDGYVEWTPRTAEPALFKVEIEPSPNDASLMNNSIREQSFFLDGTKEGPLEFDLTVRNPTSSTADLSFSTTLLPASQPPEAAPWDDQPTDGTHSVSQAGWNVTFTPATARLRAREFVRVHVLINPPPCGGLAALLKVEFLLRAGQRNVLLDRFLIHPRPYKQVLLTLNCPTRPTIVNGVYEYHFTGKLQELSCPSNTLKPIVDARVDINFDFEGLSLIGGISYTNRQGEFDRRYVDSGREFRGDREIRAYATCLGNQNQPLAKSNECTFRAPCQPLVANPGCGIPLTILVEVDANC
ncbi:MAG: hypothetical protein HY314_05440 [Acidobacteria bacterium]|nr:hypothetical protein [Acidobacteriota bacterium]